MRATYLRCSRTRCLHGKRGSRIEGVQKDEALMWKELSQSFFSCCYLLSRSNLNAKTHDNWKLNCDNPDFTAAIICIPTPPANTPDESQPSSPGGGTGGPLRNSSPYILHETVKISSL